MAEIVTAGVGFVSGWLLALFGETFRLWLVGPRLTVDFKDAGHYVTDTPEEFRDSSGKVFSTHSARYVRVRVENERTALAKACQAYLVKVESKGPDGLFRATEYAESMPLGWANVGRIRLDLPKGVPHFVDVLSSRAPVKAWQPEIGSTPLRYAPLLSRSGDHRLTVVVSGDGVPPQTIRLLFTWNGTWNNFTVRQE